MKIADRVLGGLLILGALVTAYYWWSYFFGAGEVKVSQERWYTAFESSFPFADLWMAVCGLFAGCGFLTGWRHTAPFGLMTGSAIIYLALLDITFDVENHMYAKAGGSGAMNFEVFINVACLILGVWTLIASWRRLGRP